MMISMGNPDTNVGNEMIKWGNNHTLEGSLNGMGEYYPHPPWLKYKASRISINHCGLQTHTMTKTSQSGEFAKS